MKPLSLSHDVIRDFTANSTEEEVPHPKPASGYQMGVAGIECAERKRRGEEEGGVEIPTSKDLLKVRQK